MEKNESNESNESNQAKQHATNMKKQFLKYILPSFAGVFLLLSLFWILALETSANSKYIRDGKEYGVTEGNFRGKWWNYYERGTSFAEGDFWEEAEADLKKAIEKRSEDDRRARSYGLHFVEFFPHRELGVVYFNQNRIEEAERELQLSLSQTEPGQSSISIRRARP
jgi:tetratricopeptide (TPR) repeat protein